MGWFAQSSGAQWLRVLILCGLSSSASAEIFAPVDGERLPAERAKSLTVSENPGGSDAVDEAELNAKTIEKAAESEVSTADEDSETTPEPDEETETAESETDDASEAVPADTDSNQEEASVQADAIDTQETEPADAKVEDVAPSTPSQKNSNQSIEASDVADASTSSGEDASRSQDASTPAQSNEITAGVTFPDAPKSGLWGWGLGLDVPMTGILTGNATSSTHGLGYTLGVGLGYEVVRGWVIRLALTGGETSRGEATIQYLDGGIPLTRSFEAEWLGVELGLGVQRIFKEFDPLIWPYVGLEAGPVFSGYFYRFDSAAVTTLATNDETTRYGANEYEAVGLGWAGKLSGGIRIELMPGVEWGTEYSLSLTSVSELEPVSNTRQIREVFPIQEWIFQHRLVLGLWLGL